MTQQTIIQEGDARINVTSKVFYNPAQTVNRDLSILVMNEHKGKTILDALSATGLRAIRYFKELEDVTVVANDCDQNAIHMIKENLKLNKIPIRTKKDELEKILKANDISDELIEQVISSKSYNDSGIEILEQDASTIQRNFDIIDLDPYGTASPFIDNAVRNVNKGGLLCITCTDMQTLAGGKQLESNFMKYGGFVNNSDFSHEQAVRVILNQITNSANRYKRAVKPLLCLSIDFYVRIFVQIESSALQAKDSCVNTGIVYQCLKCKWFTHQSIASKNEKNRFSPSILSVEIQCPECTSELTMTGPIYLGSLHDKEFVKKLQASLEFNDKLKLLKEAKRIKGVLSAVMDEVDAPLYLRNKGLSKVFRGEMPKGIKIRNAIWNAGYEASTSHVGGDCIKTNIPISKLYDIYRAHFAKLGVKIDENTLTGKLLSKSVDWEVNFAHHPKAAIGDKNPRYMQTGNAPLSKPKKRELEEINDSESKMVKTE
eukprot:NODE_247_length_11822_cov_1.182718.p3 type:complete len:487 gc:universal NODE_247_length_11822_cov_1.182718:3187-1727(-)